jgi:hypothetical protein
MNESLFLFVVIVWRDCMVYLCLTLFICQTGVFILQVLPTKNWFSPQKNAYADFFGEFAWHHLFIKNISLRQYIDALLENYREIFFLIF